MVDRASHSLYSEPVDPVCLLASGDGGAGSWELTAELTRGVWSTISLQSPKGNWRPKGLESGVLAMTKITGGRVSEMSKGCKRKRWMGEKASRAAGGMRGAG